MSEDISSAITEILAKHSEISGEMIVMDTRLDSVGVDSLKMVEIIFDLEERFDISIPDSSFAGMDNRQMQTVGDVARVVRQLIAEQSA